jgi:hypothetical protein
MASAYPCHVCGEPGRLVRSGGDYPPIYRCLTSVCDVVEFDERRTRRRELPPRVRVTAPGILRPRVS